MEQHGGDREWTHDPLERSFFSTVGKGYLIGMVVFGLFGFLVARSQASEWGVGAALGVGLFVAVFAGILGGVVLIGIWATKNEEMIRGDETGHPVVGEPGARDAAEPETSEGSAPETATTPEPDATVTVADVAADPDASEPVAEAATAEEGHEPAPT